MEDEVGSDGALDTAGPPAVDPAPPKAKDVDLGSPVVDQVWSVIQLCFFSLHGPDICCRNFDFIIADKEQVKRGVLPAAEAAPPVDALLVEPPNLKISVEADDV